MESTAETSVAVAGRPGWEEAQTAGNTLPPWLGDPMHHQPHAHLWAAIDWELAALAFLLLFLLFVGFVFVMRVRRWLRTEEDNTLSPQQQLDQYRTLLEQGDLGQEEYDRLRLTLERRASTQESSVDPPLT